MTYEIFLYIEVDQSITEIFVCKHQYGTETLKMLNIFKCKPTPILAIIRLKQRKEDEGQYLDFKGWEFSVFNNYNIKYNVLCEFNLKILGVIKGISLIGRNFSLDMSVLPNIVTFFTMSKMM